MHTNAVIELSRATVSAPVEPWSVFALWDDPRSWATWDSDVAWVQFRGACVIGARGRLKPRSGPATAFTITDRIEGRRLVDVTRLPGARLIFDHAVSASEVEGAPGSEITVTIAVGGPLATLWSRLLRGQLAGGARSGIDGLLAHLGRAR